MICKHGVRHYAGFRHVTRRALSFPAPALGSLQPDRLRVAAQAHSIIRTAGCGILMRIVAPAAANAAIRFIETPAQDKTRRWKAYCVGVTFDGSQSTDVSVFGRLSVTDATQTRLLERVKASRVPDAPAACACVFQAWSMAALTSDTGYVPISG
jgi:hypothetical protein